MKWSGYHGNRLFLRWWQRDFCFYFLAVGVLPSSEGNLPRLALRSSVMIRVCCQPALRVTPHYPAAERLNFAPLGLYSLVILSGGQTKKEFCQIFLTEAEGTAEAEAGRACLPPRPGSWRPWEQVRRPRCRLTQFWWCWSFNTPSILNGSKWIFKYGSSRWSSYYVWEKSFNEKFTTNRKIFKSYWNYWHVRDIAKGIRYNPRSSAIPDTGRSWGL